MPGVGHVGGTSVGEAGLQGKRLDLPQDRIWTNIDRYGNTSAASVPIALFEAIDAGKVEDGDNLVFVAFGGGLSWAAGVVRWGTAGVCRDEACRGSRSKRVADSR